MANTLILWSTLSTGEIPSFVDSFETVSGFINIGSTILTDIESMSKGLLFWRLHWIGGMGVIVFAFAILPQSNANDMYIMKAEVPGHKVGKLVSCNIFMTNFVWNLYRTYHCRGRIFVYGRV